MEILFVRVFSLYQWSVSADIREVEEANCTEIVLRRRATTSLLPRFIFMTARCVFLLKSGPVAFEPWKSENVPLSGVTRFITKVMLLISTFR